MPKHYKPHRINNTSYNGNTAHKEVKMKKPDFNRVWDRICEELEERPIVILGLVSTVVYGASHIMDSNTRRANAKTERKRTKIYDKEVERRIRQQQKQK
jgi:hypothetical protein